jgi:hypothetical protein
MGLHGRYISPKLPRLPARGGEPGMSVILISRSELRRLPRRRCGVYWRKEVRNKVRNKDVHRCILIPLYWRENIRNQDIHPCILIPLYRRKEIRNKDVHPCILIPAYWRKEIRGKDIHPCILIPRCCPSILLDQVAAPLSQELPPGSQIQLMTSL